MPRTFEEVVRDGINRTLFAKQVEAVPKKRRLVTKLVQPAKQMFAPREKRIRIREAAQKLHQVILTYTKETTGETKKYRVAPYSYRYRRLKVGRRKLLFAWDMDDEKIKGFVLRNIKHVEPTTKRFQPRWRVEL
jgi:predicted DNA-binding transcriptional regulator YafY